MYCRSSIFKSTSFSVASIGYVAKPLYKLMFPLGAPLINFILSCTNFEHGKTMPFKSKTLAFKRLKYRQCSQLQFYDEFLSCLAIYP